MLLSLFAHSITGSAASGEICNNCGLRKFVAFAKVMGGMVNRDHCITTQYVISLAKFGHDREGRFHIVGTTQSDALSAFVY